MTRTTSRLADAATLDESCKALINPDCNVVLGSHADEFDLKRKTAITNDATSILVAAGAAARAGRLFVIEYGAIAEGLKSVSKREDVSCKLPFEVTPILVSGFQGGGVIPLFVVRRETLESHNLMTAVLYKNEEESFWETPGFGADAVTQDAVQTIAGGLLAVINARNLKPVALLQ